MDKINISGSVWTDIRVSDLWEKTRPVAPLRKEEKKIRKVEVKVGFKGDEIDTD